MKDIQIIDNFLSEENHRMLSEVLSGNSFPWTYVDSKVYDGDGEFQLSHTFYKNFTFTSNNAVILEPIIDKLNPTAIRKIRSNMTFKKDSIYHYEMHTDHKDNFENCKTGVYYINSNTKTRYYYWLE